MSASVARLDRVSVVYGDQRVLDGFTLDLPAGCFVTLLGPSGCGKTTILRLLGGFIRPTTGRVWLHGGGGLADVTHLPPERRNVNMVFQDYALFPHLTVAGNIAFGLRRQGLSRDAIRATVAHLLGLVRLDGLDGRMPDQLSGGQRQRVALARALARDPPLLLLDEPLGALDAPLRAEMQTELRCLQRHTGKTFLLVTHDQAEAMAVSDVIAVVNDGRIEQMGAPEALYSRPATRFVASFLGENNILRCQVGHADPDGATLTWRGQRLVTVGGQELRSGDSVEVAVRPEHVRCIAGLNGRASGVTGRVQSRTFRGGSTLLLIELARGDTVLAAMAPTDAHAVGDEVGVAIDSSRVSILDRPHPPVIAARTEFSERDAAPPSSRTLVGTHSRAFCHDLG
jgi:spermidine/putrescine transport system ATP-binding protein